MKTPKTLPIHGARAEFMVALLKWNGVASRNDLGPQTSQAENAARQYCRRHGWVEFDGWYWRMTDKGRTAFQSQRAE